MTAACPAPTSAAYLTRTPASPAGRDAVETALVTDPRDHALDERERMHARLIDEMGHGDADRFWTRPRADLGGMSCGELWALGMRESVRDLYRRTLVLAAVRRDVEDALADRAEVDGQEVLDGDSD